MIGSYLPGFLAAGAGLFFIVRGELTPGLPILCGACQRDPILLWGREVPLFPEASANG